MAEDFALAEREWGEVMAAVRRNLQFVSESTGERRKVAVQDTERKFEEARDSLRAMDAAAKRATTGRMQMNNKIASYRNELSKGEKQLLVSIPTPGARTGGSSSLDEAEAQQRQNLISGYQTTAKSGQRLDNSNQKMAETEQMGREAHQALVGQGNQLRHADETLYGADDDITAQRKTLRNMARRVVTNKLIMMLIVAVQVVTILIIVFCKWIIPLLKK